MSIHVQLERFEGPLALLLHLIRSQEMDIFDINVHQITQQYLDYIRMMKKLDLEVAGEFVAMAATLIHIKSRLLLPQYNEEGEEIDVEDPRKELVQKLLEYQKYQEASQKLYERPLLGRDLWVRGRREDFTADQEEEIVTEENALFSLISSYRTALRNMKKTVHRVGTALQSIASRILEIRDKLIVGQKVMFSQLIDSKDQKLSQVLMTFLSLLELAKLGFVTVYQSENFGDIHIEAKKEIDRDVVVRVEEFDSTDEQRAQAAEALMAAPAVTAAAEEVFDFDAPLEEGESVEAQIPLMVSEQDQDFEVEAATDDEILAEEERMRSEGPHEEGLA